MPLKEMLKTASLFPFLIIVFFSIGNVVPPLTKHRQPDFGEVRTIYLIFACRNAWCYQPMRVLPTAQDSFVQCWVTQILELYRAASLDEANSLLGTLLLHLERRENPIQPDHILPERFRQAVEYLTRHLDENIPIATLTKRFSYSPPRFNRLFHQYFGCGPTLYREERRMAQARKMLHNTHLTISEIGFACGYPTAHYFSRIFRKVHGFSPSAYRGHQVCYWAKLSPDAPAIHCI